MGSVNHVQSFTYDAVDDQVLLQKIFPIDIYLQLQALAPNGTGRTEWESNINSIIWNLLGDKRPLSINGRGGILFPDRVESPDGPTLALEESYQARWGYWYSGALLGKVRAEDPPGTERWLAVATGPGLIQVEARTGNRLRKIDIPPAGPGVTDPFLPIPASPDRITDNGIVLAAYATTKELWLNGKRYSISDLTDGTTWQDITPQHIASNGTIAALATRITGGAREIILLTPVTVEELSPKLVDDADAAIPGSNYATPLPASNAMVERDPIGRTAVAATATTPAVTAIPAVSDASTRRIAWRDMKVKVGKMFAGRTVTWSMTARFTPSVVTSAVGDTPEVLGPNPTGVRFRGSWAHAYHITTGQQVDYRRSFTASEAYALHGFAVQNRTVEATPGTATTTVDADGYTAIRVNVPPIGFNKARVSIEITGVPGKLDILDLEVPAVVVIDPGHGGADGGADSISREMTEASVVLDVALKSEPHIRGALSQISPLYKLLLTREEDVAVSIDERNGVEPGTSRQGIQRYKGADVFLSIHCNSGGSSARRVETNIQWGRVSWENISADAANQGNYNHNYDKVLGKTVNDTVASVLRYYDPVTPNRGVVRNDRYANGPGVLRDSSMANGNSNAMTPAYHPLRSALVELEFISNPDGDALLISGKGEVTPTNPGTWDSNEVREDLATGIAGAIGEVIRQ